MHCIPEDNGSHCIAIEVNLTFLDENDNINGIMKSCCHIKSSLLCAVVKMLTDLSHACFH